MLWTIFLKSILIVLTISKHCTGYYIRNRKIRTSGKYNFSMGERKFFNKDFIEKEENEMILPLSIVKIDNLTDTNSFPSEFTLSFEGIDYKFHLVNKQSTGQMDIYTNSIENSGQIFKFQHSRLEIVLKFFI